MALTLLASHDPYPACLLACTRVGGLSGLANQLSMLGDDDDRFRLIFEGGGMDT